MRGFVNAHCHAFQRALRGRTEGADFWAWRDTMLELARGQTPGRVRDEYAAVYRELRAAGYTAVGEFHYLGLAEARAAVEAAGEAGVEIALLYVAYERGGLERFRQESVGEYLRQLEQLRGGRARRCRPPLRARVLTRLARGARPLCGGGGLALARPRRRAAARDRGVRRRARHASDRAARRDRLPQRADNSGSRDACRRRELDLLGRAGARVCACPTTEANLGDGFLPVERVLHRDIALCIGSDSNVRIDPLEELRELDGIARRQAGRRDVLTVDALLSIGADEGAASLGLETWPSIEIDAAHPQLRGVEDPTRALVASCCADVVVD